MSTRTGSTWHNVMTCPSGTLVGYSAWFFLFVLWKRQEVIRKEKGGHHFILRPYSLHHMGGSHHLRELQEELWVQGEVRSVSEQEGDTWITRFHTENTMEANTWTILQTRTYGKHLYCGGWDQGVREGENAPYCCFISRYT